MLISLDLIFHKARQVPTVLAHAFARRLFVKENECSQARSCTFFLPKFLENFVNLWFRWLDSADDISSKVESSAPAASPCATCAFPPIGTLARREVETPTSAQHMVSLAQLAVLSTSCPYTSFFPASPDVFAGSAFPISPLLAGLPTFYSLQLIEYDRHLSHDFTVRERTFAIMAPEGTAVGGDCARIVGGGR